MAISFWLASAAWLAGNFNQFVIFISFILLFYAPLSILVTKYLANAGFSESPGKVCGYQIAFLLLIPLYMLRKWLPVPPVFTDSACCILLTFFGYRSYLYDSKTRSPEVFPRLFWFAQLILIPITICLSWTGFEIHFQDKIYYLGQHIVDSGTLSGVISAISISPGIPLYPVTGLGELNYHWLFFTIPAFISEFLGSSGKHATSMILGNLLIAHLLFLTLYSVAGVYVENSKRKGYIQALGATLIIFSSYSFAYFVIFGVKIPPVNNLLMSLPYSINFFGNNTLAITLVISTIMLLFEWNRTSEKKYICMGALFLGLTAGLSVTLTFSAFLGVILLIIFKQIRKPLQAITIGLAVGIVCLAFFKGLGVFSGGHANRICIDFDDGLFVKNFFITFLPAISVAYYGIMNMPFANPFSLFVFSGLVIPTMLMLENSPYGRIDFSMKTASLLIALMTPVLARGVEVLISKRNSIMVLIPLSLLTLGTILFGLMAANFLLVRQSLVRKGVIETRKFFCIDRDYFLSLDYLRQTSAKPAILIDPFFADQKEAHVNLMISQRRQFLPIQKDSFMGIASDEVLQRRQIWNKWEKGAFQNPQTSLFFARNGNYLIAKGDIPGENWEMVFKQGNYRVFKSKVMQN